MYTSVYQVYINLLLEPHCIAHPAVLYSCFLFLFVFVGAFSSSETLRATGKSSDFAKVSHFYVLMCSCNLTVAVQLHILIHMSAAITVIILIVA